MRKIILAAAAMFMATGAFAQIEWGVKVGANASSLTNSDFLESSSTFDSKMKFSVYAGIFAEFRINDYLGIQPELLYSRQGVRYDDKIAGVKVKGWHRLNYLNLPVLAKIYVLENLSIDLGPQFGYLLNYNGELKVDGDKIIDDDSKDGLKEFDVSFAMGATFKITENLDLSARYNLGLTKVNDGDGDKMKNGVIQLGLGMRF